MNYTSKLQLKNDFYKKMNGATLLHCHILFNTIFKNFITQ